MSTKELSKELLKKKKVANYSFLIAFFLIFSFFVFFAIKPNLETAFTLKKELQELKQLDSSYDVAISQIIDTQSSLTIHRDELPLLEQALPVSPQVNRLFADLQKSASNSGVPISRIAVAQVNIKDQKLKVASMESYIVNFETVSPFASLQKFITDFTAQRRLKLVKKMDIRKNDLEASGSSNLIKVSLEISGQYL